MRQQKWWYCKVGGKKVNLRARANVGMASKGSVYLGSLKLESTPDKLDNKTRKLPSNLDEPLLASLYDSVMSPASVVLAEPLQFPQAIFRTQKFTTVYEQINTRHMSNLRISCEVHGIWGERGERSRVHHERPGSGSLTPYWDLKGQR